MNPLYIFIRQTKAETTQIKTELLYD